MTRTITIGTQTYLLKPEQLIQSGGEGMVFKIGETAVKLYHQPQTQHAQKLDQFLNSSFVNQVPAGVLAPSHIVTNSQGDFSGFQMPLLPTGAVPFKHLAKNTFWQKQRLTTQAVLKLFQRLHAVLETLHNLGIVVGDLNDQNVFLNVAMDQNTGTIQLTPYFLDVDSYQFGRFPCPVAMDLFVDPNLYGIDDLSQRPFFSPATDWYAYFVLLVRSLLLIHPYGGVHHQFKSIAARATNNMSILNSEVTYPPSARPRESLPDALLQHLHRVFDNGERPPFPLSLITDYANNLTVCTQCQHEYPQERPFCPFCAHKTTAKPAPAPTTSTTPTNLYATDGIIESVHALPNGRFLAIVFADNQYKLVRFGLGGVLDEMMLFNGQAGYRFAAFQTYLAVNPPGGKQLLLLDISSAQPQKIEMLETAAFRETAVFAATPHHLYRIAGTWIMRGSVKQGHYVEEAIATAHRNQTWFQASPTSETIAGYHRVFAENRFFIWHEGQSFDIPIPTVNVGESIAETMVLFAPDSVSFQLQINMRGTSQTAVYQTTHRGELTLQKTSAQQIETKPHIQLAAGQLNHTTHEIWFYPTHA